LRFALVIVVFDEWEWLDDASDSLIGTDTDPIL